MTKERRAELDYLWDDDSGEVVRMFEDPKAPDFPAMLMAITDTMAAHPWWRSVEGTPLANDLPVRAAVAAMRLVERKP